MSSTSFTALRRFFNAGSPATDSLQANTPSSDVSRPDATSGRRATTTDKQAGKASRSPRHQLAEFLPPRMATSHATECSSAASRSVSGEPRRSLADLPRNVLQKIGIDLKSRPDMINLALASPSMQFALLPAANGEQLDFLKEMAQSVKDLESVRLVLRSSRSMPSAPHAILIDDLIASLRGLVKADGSFFKMQAAAADAAEGFRLLASHIAELPGPQRSGLSVSLAPHLNLLPANERYDAMEALLKEAREPADKFKMISCLALGISQFNYSDLSKIAQVLTNEAATLPLGERQRLQGSFRTGMNCKMLDTDRNYMEQLLARLVKDDGRPLSRSDGPSPHLT